MSVEVKITVLGEAGIGKSTLIVRFITNIFVDEYDSTIEDNYRKHFSVDDVSYLLDTFDTTGPEEYTPMREYFIRNSHGVLLLFSVTDRESFELVSHYHSQALNTKDNIVFPMLLVGCKCDLEAEREVAEDEAKNLARDMKMNYMETSSLTGQNVDEIFSEIVRAIEKTGVLQAQKTMQQQKKTTKVGCQIA